VKSKVAANSKKNLIRAVIQASKFAWPVSLNPWPSLCISQYILIHGAAPFFHSLLLQLGCLFYLFY